MQIRRDDSHAFSFRKRRERPWRIIIIFSIFIIALLFIIDSNYSRFQILALEVVGQAPAPTQFASFYATNASQQFVQGDLIGARNNYQQAIRQQPNNINYLYEYGRVLLELGAEDVTYWQEAATIGEQISQIDPNNPRGYYIQSRAQDQLGNSEIAVPLAQQGLNLDANFAPLYAALSSAYRNIDRYDVALSFAEQSISRDPNDAGARRIYAYALMWLGRYDEAIAQLEQAIVLNPNMTGPYFELAGQYLSRSSQMFGSALGTEYAARAIATLTLITQMQPDNARAYLRLCDAYFSIGENITATQYCQQALNINPEYAVAWASLGQTQYSRRNYESAIESFETCLRYGSTDIRCYYLRGLALYYLGNCEDAWNVLTEAQNLIQQENQNPNNPVLLATMEGLRLITATSSCTGFANRALPTAIPPTAIPPTPIGG